MANVSPIIDSLQGEENLPVLADIDSRIVLLNICGPLLPVLRLSRKLHTHNVALRGND